METIIKFKFIYLLKLQSFSQLREQHEATKTQASKTKQLKLIIIKIQKKNLIPVITEANGTTSKPFRKYNKNITGKHEIKELQKTAKLGKAHKLEEVKVKVK